MVTPAQDDRLFRPSGFPRLMACAGSHELAQHYPEPDEDEDEGDGDAAADGTAAHWCGELLLTGKELPAIGSKAPNGRTIDKEMIAGARLYNEYVRDIVPPTAKINVEHKVDCSIVHRRCWGQIDADAVFRNEAHVFDYKHGFNFVSEYMNWQLLGYAAGLLDMGTAIPAVDESISVTLHIIQPRAYGRGPACRAWKIPSGVLLERAIQIRNRLADIERGGMACSTGEQCHYCPARRGCEALSVAAQHAAQVTRGSAPLDMTDAQAGVELAILRQMSKAMDYRIKGLEAQVEHALGAGAVIPHFTMRRTEGREAWRQSDEQVISFGKLMGVNLAKPIEAITPTQARKLVPDPSLIDSLAGKPIVTKLAEVDHVSIARVFETVDNA